MTRHGTGLPWDHTVPELFAAQARRTPDAVAVSCAGLAVSYAELDARSNQIAGWLRCHGVGVEDVVAVRLQRGTDLVAALLGIVKAGAAYLALEAEAPPTMLDELVASVRARALVTDHDTDDPVLPTLRLPGGLATAEPNGLPEVHPDNLAYIAFTSGSTGAPKGVGVPHRAVARLALGDAAHFGADHVFLLLAPVSFDASTLEIWGPLLTGGRLAVYPPGPVDIDGLDRVLERESVTSLWLTSGLFHRMVDYRLDALGRVQQLLAGGDVLDPVRVNRFVERHGAARFINGYGPTENTTFASCNTIARPVRDGYVPIGHAIAGTRLYVLDAALRPVERGGQGELWIAGAGLARGYVTDTRATADRFRPDPFAVAPGERMYRTGDLVRHRGDGDLEFLGRVDRQVKIRGFRVEPAEIERTLTSLPGVRDAIVASRRTGGRDTCLVAYVVSDGSAGEHLPTWLRRELRRLVPPYLIPSMFVEVDELPLTPNGKVDRARLPPPERGRRDSEATFAAAASPTEQLVCDMWAEALEIDRVGVLDEFFELGGNSLLAMDLMSRMEAVVGVALPYRTLLENSTVQDFATAVDSLLVPAGERP